ncbi:MAG: hypothetical protein WCG49_10495 [Actinomycetes bacterium]
MKVLSQALCAGIVLASVAGCAQDPNDTLSANASDTAADGSTLIIASVREWKVSANRISVSAGPTTFLVSNLGTIKHEFLLTKTDFANGQIPIDSKLNKFSEEGKGVKVVKEISEWAPLTTQLLTLTWRPVITSCSATSQAITATACTPS